MGSGRRREWLLVLSGGLEWEDAQAPFESMVIEAEEVYLAERVHRCHLSRSPHWINASPGILPRSTDSRVISAVGEQTVSHKDSRVRAKARVRSEGNRNVASYILYVDGY